MSDLHLFSALCERTRPASWSSICGPASVRLHIQDLESEIARARSMDELADIGFQALDPAPRRARGHEPRVCTRAWQLWSSVEWVLASTSDGALVGTYENGTRRDGQLELTDQAAWQFLFAKDLLLALAQPQEAAILHDRVAHCFGRFGRQVLDWAKIHNPQLLHLIDRPQRDSLLHLNPTLFNDRLRPEHDVVRTTALLNIVLGREQWRALTQWMAEERPISESNSTPEALETNFLAFCRGLNHERWMEKRNNRPLYQQDLDKAVREGQAYVDRFLPPEQQSLGDLARLVADHFGFRSVSVFPVGGAQRARQELLRACDAFGNLATKTQLPPASMGLGGLALRLALSKRSAPRGDLAFFSEPSIHFGPRTSRQPGTLSFCAPLTGLDHEWTHAWDSHLKKPHVALTPEGQPTPLAQAHAHLQHAAEGHMPVAAHTKRAFIRSFERPLFSRLISILGKTDDETWVSFFARTGNIQTKESAQNHRIPPTFKREARAVLEAVRSGSEKTLVNTLLPLMTNSFHSWEGEPLQALRNRARTAVQDLLQERQMLRKAIESTQWRQDAGPFVWAAALHDHRNKIRYWNTPAEKLARACETLLGADALVPHKDLRWPGPEADLPEYAFPIANEHALSFYSLLRTEEQTRFRAAFESFLEYARPTFEQLAHEGAGPSTNLSHPTADQLERIAGFRVSLPLIAIPLLGKPETAEPLSLSASQPRNLHDFREQASPVSSAPVDPNRPAARRY